MRRGCAGWGRGRGGAAPSSVLSAPSQHRAHIVPRTSSASRQDGAPFTRTPARGARALRGAAASVPVRFCAPAGRVRAAQGGC